MPKEKWNMTSEAPISASLHKIGITAKVPHHLFTKPHRLDILLLQQKRRHIQGRTENYQTHAGASTAEAHERKNADERPYFKPSFRLGPNEMLNSKKICYISNLTRANITSAFIVPIYYHCLRVLHRLRGRKSSASTSWVAVPFLRGQPEMPLFSPGSWASRLRAQQTL